MVAQAMKSGDALLVAWSKTLARQGDQPAIFHETGEVSRRFCEVEEQAALFEKMLDKFSPGDVIGIQIGNHEDWPALILANLRRELITLPLERSISAQERDAALAMSHAVALASAVPGKSPEILPLQTSTSSVAPWRDDPPALLKLTSGTTATPRAVVFRSHQLLADCNQICDTMGITESDLNFGVIPISHSYGFSNLLTPLLARGVPLALSNDRLPRAILKNLERTKATILPGMPVFYQAFCEMEQTPALPQLRLCISAGAPLTAQLAANFHRKFGRSIHSFYGSSECGGICYDRDGKAEDDGFVGIPMKGVEIEPVDDASASTQIRVRSAAVGNGYFPEEDRAKLGNGVYVPDDLVVRRENGFTIVGRISDLINVAGKKVNPAEVEAQLMQFSGVRQAVVFGRKSLARNEEVAACVVAQPNVQISDLLQFCRSRLSGWQVPKRIFLVEKMPVTERGKTSRRELAERFADL